MLSVLDNYTLDNPDEIAKEIANDFRKRRIEKNLTREQVSEKAGVAVSNIVRFEQKGLISLKNLIGIAKPSYPYEFPIHAISRKPTPRSHGSRSPAHEKPLPSVPLYPPAILWKKRHPL